MTDQLPGGIGISLLHVYDVPAPDGVIGGSPHVHLACAEGYYVIGGAGAVQTLNHKGYTETPLQQGAVVWFDPGTIHRLVNGGDLRILTLMSNSCRPEAGDAVLTYPPEHLRDRPSYDAVTTLLGPDLTAAAMRRRDLALQGFQALRRSYDEQGPAALEPFYTAAAELVRPRITDWRQRWQAGAKAQADATGNHLDALEQGITDHLTDAEVNAFATPTELGRHGMCGRLDVYHH
jgi:hypothetical protein